MNTSVTNTAEFLFLIMMEVKCIKYYKRYQYMRDRVSKCPQTFVSDNVRQSPFGSLMTGSPPRQIHTQETMPPQIK